MINRKQLIHTIIFAIMMAINALFWQEPFFDGEKSPPLTLVLFVGLFGVVLPVSIMIEMIARKFGKYALFISFLLYQLFPVYMYSNVFQDLHSLFIFVPVTLYWILDVWFYRLQIRSTKAENNGNTLFTIVSLIFPALCLLFLIVMVIYNL
jgi:hypothetical protein